jgi:hypothetical protein
VGSGFGTGVVSTGAGVLVGVCVGAGVGSCVGCGVEAGFSVGVLVAGLGLVPVGVSDTVPAAEEPSVGLVLVVELSVESSSALDIVFLTSFATIGCAEAKAFSVSVGSERSFDSSRLLSEEEPDELSTEPSVSCGISLVPTLAQPDKQRIRVRTNGKRMRFIVITPCFFAFSLATKNKVCNDANGLD